VNRGITTLSNPTNVLLNHLPTDVLGRLEGHLAPVVLMQGQILHKPGDKIRALYFPTTSLISVTVKMRGGKSIETGAIGSREVVGINALMSGDETTQTEYIVRLSGDAIRVEAGVLRHEFDRNTELRDVMLRYTQAFIAQTSQNVGCNRLHNLNRRFSRWLLEVRERVQADEFPLTHEFMAVILGTRRASVSEAAGKLKTSGIIDYKRNIFQIKEPSVLETLSCECYFALKAEYERLLG
jgi:CRP-like cAMP-binding protein